MKELPQQFACWNIALSLADDEPLARAVLAGFVYIAAGKGELKLPEQWHFEDFSAEVMTEQFGADGEPPASICWIKGTAVAGPESAPASASKS